MSPPNDHHHHPFVARSTKYRTLCDLPVELLSIIVSRIAHCKGIAVPCSLVCRCLRAVVIEHLFSKRLIAYGIESCDHLLSFLQANPNVSQKIQTLKMSGETLDDIAVAKLMALLPKLAELELGRFVYPLRVPPSDSVPRQDNPRLFTLNTLRFDIPDFRSKTLEDASPIAGFLRILSLFHIKKLTTGQSHGRQSEFDTSTPLDLGLLHRPLKIHELLVGLSLRQELDMKSIPFLINILAHAIEPGSLQKLIVRPNSGAAVSAIGSLFARAGGELKTLSIAGDAPSPVSKRSGWEDPLDTNWHALNLAACPKLESIEIEIFFRAPCDESQPQNIPALSLAGAGMLSQASGTLRKVSIIIWDLPRISTLNNKRTLRLQAFDKVVTAYRFPVIQEVRVAVMPQRALCMSAGYEWLKVVAAVQKALPSLHSRGLLDVTWTP